jgi:trk system potassium uptake protein TrkA
MKTYFVVGLGRFGYETARALSAMGCEVLAMDVYNDVVQAISAEVTHAVVGDSRDKDVLKALEHKDTTQQNLIAAVKAHLTT